MAPALLSFSTWLLWVIPWNGIRGSWIATAPRKLQTAHAANRDLQLPQGINGKVSRARGTNWSSPCIFCLLTAGPTLGLVSNCVWACASFYGQPHQGLGTSRTWKSESKPHWAPSCWYWVFLYLLRSHHSFVLKHNHRDVHRDHHSLVGEDEEEATREPLDWDGHPINHFCYRQIGNTGPQTETHFPLTWTFMGSKINLHCWATRLFLFLCFCTNLSHDQLLKPR